MSVRFFCTLFDSNYLLKGAAMLRSLKQHNPDASVFVLCLDAETQSVLEGMGLEDVVCIPLADVEDEDLLRVKSERTVAEYCWTLSPVVPSYVLDTYEYVDMVTYLDADLLFFGSVDPLFEEIGDGSVAIVEHRFTEKLVYLAPDVGRFNVEWVGFRRDEQGLACVRRWRAQCIEWCYDRVEDGKMGDQKYLDEWPALFSKCHVLQHPGAGVAPWNYAASEFQTLDDGTILVDGAPLVFYHFQRFQILPDGSFERGVRRYSNVPEPESVYQQYEDALTRMADDLARPEAAEPPVVARVMDVTEVTYETGFHSWAEAAQRSAGYDAGVIFDKALTSARMVSAGLAAYERDTVTFQVREIEHPMLAWMLYAAAADDRLSVMDFGGAFGSRYYQHRFLLDGVEGLAWGVVEQAHFVAAGQQEFETDALRFFPTAEECVAAIAPNFLQLSSVLMYFEDPYALLDELLGLGIPYVFIDLTMAWRRIGDVLAVEHVPASIYAASYPLWLLDADKLEAHFTQHGYVIVDHFIPHPDWRFGPPTARSPYLGWFLYRPR